MRKGKGEKKRLGKTGEEARPRMKDAGCLWSFKIIANKKGNRTRGGDHDMKKTPGRRQEGIEHYLGQKQVC